MNQNRGLCLLLIATLFCFSVRADLLPFPLSAGQRGTVTCLDHPDIAYDIYLPPAYSTNGPALPIFYTMSSGGGGMVTSFQSALTQLNIIGVGLIGSRNSAPLGVLEREAFAVVRDVRRRMPSSEPVTSAR